MATALFLALGLAVAPSGSAQDVGNTLSVNDVQMYYEVVGEGARSFLHDFGGCAQRWQPHVKQLAQQYRLIIPDLRGQGRSTNPTGQFTRSTGGTQHLCFTR